MVDIKHFQQKLLQKLYKEKQRVEWYRNHNLQRQKWGRKVLKDKNKITERNCPICGTRNTGIVLKAPVYHFTKCTKCDLVYANLILNGDEVENFYKNDKIYQSLWNKKYDSVVKNRNIKKHKPITDIILKYTNGRDECLDVGCSWGKLLYELKPYFKEVEGVELNVETSRQGEELFGIKIHNQSLEKLNLPSDLYNLVILNQVIEHLNNFDIFYEIYRILKHKGIVYVGCPNMDSWSIKLFKDKHNHVRSTGHINMFNKKSFQFFARKYGFKIKMIRSTNRLDINPIDFIYYYLKPSQFIHRHNYNFFISPLSLVVERITLYVLSKINLLSKTGRGSYLEVIFEK